MSCSRLTKVAIPSDGICLAASSIDVVCLSGGFGPYTKQRQASAVQHRVGADERGVTRAEPRSQLNAVLGVEEEET